MSIYKYVVITPATNKSKPIIKSNGLLIVPNIKKSYKYYLECCRYNPIKFENEYFILLSNNKFDERCKTCRVDDYGRLKLVIKSEMKDVLLKQMTDYSNVNFEYLESEDDYDVFTINQ